MSAQWFDENEAPPASGSAGTMTKGAGSTVKKETVFRGNWAPTVEVPLRFGAYGGHFVPIAPAIEPMGKRVMAEEDADATPAIRMRATGPPADESIQFSVFDRNFEYRSCVTQDGRVLNAYHDLIGYVSGTEAGSVSEQYLGRVHQTRFDNQYQVWAAAANNDEDLVAIIDMGTHTVRYPQGGTAFEIESSGRIRSRNGTHLGQLQGMRGFHDLETIALYLLLIDPTFTCDDEMPVSSDPKF